MPGCEAGARGLAVNPTETRAAIYRASSTLEAVQPLEQACELNNRGSLERRGWQLLTKFLLSCGLREEKTRDRMFQGKNGQWASPAKVT